MMAIALTLGALACGGAGAVAPVKTTAAERPSSSASQDAPTPAGPPFKVPFVVVADDAPYEQPPTPVTRSMLNVRPGEPFPLPKGVDACTALRKLHDDLVARTFPDAPEHEHVQSLAEEFQCSAGPNGTWAVLARRLDLGDQKLEGSMSWVSYEGAFALVFVRPSGEQVVGEFSARFGEPDQDWVNNLAPVDFDVDGVPEVFFTYVRQTAGSASQRGSYFFSVQDGTIRRITPKGTERLGILYLEDIDNDGALDATTFGFYSDAAHDPTERNVDGPMLLLHATAQGFVSDDAVTQEFAKRFCPTKPAALDESNLELSGACSILWGVDASQIRPRVDELCEGQDPDEFRDGCEVGQVVLSWYKQPQLVRLR